MTGMMLVLCSRNWKRFGRPLENNVHGRRKPGLVVISFGKRSSKAASTSSLTTTRAAPCMNSHELVGGARHLEVAKQNSNVMR
jgi:hypothetical protein